jgi:hypothetical protein
MGSLVERKTYKQNQKIKDFSKSSALLQQSSLGIYSGACTFMVMWESTLGTASHLSMLH